MESSEKITDGNSSQIKNSIVKCDLIILGAGPAGLTAAIYAARAKLHTVVIDNNFIGGQVVTTFHIANYPGTSGVVNGVDIINNMIEQAVSFGASVEGIQQIIEVNLVGSEKFVKTEKIDYYCKSIIIATGAKSRKLPVKDEAEFRGKGIHYCATCDGALYQGAELLVVGGGTSAIEEALFLTRYAKSVTIINRKDIFKASKGAVEEALSNPLISVKWNTIVKDVVGDKFITGAILEDTKTGQLLEFGTEGIFVYIGMEPSVSGFNSELELSPAGYIKTDERMMTNIDGVFAAGDVREKEVRQISTAVGDGTIAGVMAERYINRKIY
jgi:thioredoxin reductase (NADPH)